MCGGWLVRGAPQLLAHVNLLLATYVGAALATAARLKWDPSTNVVLRELIPAEYPGLVGGVLGAALLLLLLGHAALHSVLPRVRRCLLLAYAVGMFVMLCGEVAGAAWAGLQVEAFLASPAARRLAAARAQLQQHLEPLIDMLTEMKILPANLKELLEEAQADLLRSGYVAAAAVAGLLLLQAAAVVLALLARRTRPYTDTHSVLPKPERRLLKRPLPAALAP